MFIYNFKKHFGDKSIECTAEKFYVYSAFSIGFLVALIFNFEYFRLKSIEQAITNLNSVVNVSSKALTAFKFILLQIRSEFIFVLITLTASYSVVPRFSLDTLAAVKGYQLATIIKVIYSSNIAASLFSKIIVTTIEISYSAVLMNYIIELIDTINTINIDPKKNEFAILFSSQSCTRLHSTLIACGSIILFNLLKNLLLTLISLF